MEANRNGKKRTGQSDVSAGQTGPRLYTKGSGSRRDYLLTGATWQKVLSKIRASSPPFRNPLHEMGIIALILALLYPGAAAGERAPTAMAALVQSSFHG
jgi:hypothetical protein